MKLRGSIFRKGIVTLILLLLTPTICFTQKIQKILASEYEYKTISSGKNYPTVNVRANNLGDICVLLHYRIPLEEIRKHFGWSESELQSKLDILLQHDLIKRDGKLGYLPTFMVITLEDGKKLAAQGRPLVRQASQMIVRQIPEIKKRYAQIEGFRSIDFANASLLILSDVILDNWQINNVEKQFLKAERTSRHGMRYYYSIQQKAMGQTTEAFGIYGNQYRGYGTVLLGLYGNQRQRPNFINLSPSQLRDWFGIEDDEAEAFKRKLLDELLKLSKDSGYRLNDKLKQGFERLGFLENGKLTILVLSTRDEQQLSELAHIVTDELIGLLESYRNNLRNKYRKSVYAQEISFEEYCIWWYHFFYTEVTNDLILKGYIKTPDSGNYTYLIER